MSQTIKWNPVTTPNIVAYEVLHSDTGIDGEYTALTTVLHQIPGPNWIEEEGVFFYEDEDEPSRWYQLRTLDSFGNTAENEAPTPFQAGNDPVEAPSLHFLVLNEDAGGQNNLQYVTEGGTPVEGATVRIYKKFDWDMRNYDKTIGSTITTASGKWANPVFIEPGETYTIVYHKVYEYGPDTTEITV